MAPRGRTLYPIVSSSVLRLTFELDQLEQQVLLYSGTVVILIPWSNTLDNLKRPASFWHSLRESANIWSKAIEIQASIRVTSRNNGAIKQYTVAH
jgi:hypothetical protein